MRTEGRKEHKRIGELGSYVYLFIADSAVPVKVTAHLAADIPPAGSYTLPSHREPVATHRCPRGFSVSLIDMGS